MSNRQSTARRRVATASSLVEAQGRDILQIKMEDGLRWADIGAILHKSEDQVAKYADGSATMDFVSFLRGKAAWAGRFSGSVDRLLREDAGTPDAHRTQSCILECAFNLSIALQDGDLSLEEVAKNRATLELARSAIDDQLARLIPTEVDKAS